MTFKKIVNKAIDKVILKNPLKQEADSSISMRKIDRWADVRLVISDFDGVMTDNRVWVDETGKETVCVSRADGQAVHILRDMGIELVILSTEINGVVGKRAEKLKVECIQGVSDKAGCLKEYCRRKNIPLENVAYVGNDINDYGAIQLAGVRIVPHDAYSVVKEIADYVTEAKGGHGVIREIAELVLNERADWKVKNG